jgi:hypothetical protein
MSRLAVFGGVVTDQKPPGIPRRDISEKWDEEMRTSEEHQVLPPAVLSTNIAG